LVIVVALFNNGALIMMILDKRKFKTPLGIEIKDLRKIFFWNATECFGGIIGLLLGITIVLLQQHFSW
jgi:ABC-type lipoprotein release transport system permease subunit